jgi:hypothetical protein
MCDFCFVRRDFLIKPIKERIAGGGGDRREDEVLLKGVASWEREEDLIWGCFFLP